MVLHEIIFIISLPFLYPHVDKNVKMKCMTTELLSRKAHLKLPIPLAKKERRMNQHYFPVSVLSSTEHFPNLLSDLLNFLLLIKEKISLHLHLKKLESN